MHDQSTTRRRLLYGAGTAATIAIAGCGSSDSTTTAGDGGGTDSGGTTTEMGGGSMNGETANVRVAHMSPNAPNVDVYVDGGDPVLSDVPFKTVSDYLQVPAGDRQIEITAAGDPSTSVADETVPVEAGTDYTVTAAGELGDMADQPFKLLVLQDNNSEVGGDMARLRVVHASPDAPSVDVTAGGGDVVLFDNVPYGESGYTGVGAGDYTVQVRGNTDTNDGDVVADFDVSLNGGTVYTAFATGYLTPGDDPSDASFDLVVAQDNSM